MNENSTGWVDPKDDPNDYTRTPAKPIYPGSTNQDPPASERGRAWADQYLPGGAAGHPGKKGWRQAFKEWQRGRYVPYRAMGQVQIASERLGYEQPRHDLQNYYSQELQDPSIDLHKDQEGTLGKLSAWARGEGGAGAYHMDMSPTIGRLSSYVQQRLGVGLTPEQEASIRGRGMESVNSATQDAVRSESSRMAAAGMDPRSGAAASRFGQIANARAQGLTGVERNVTDENLQRIREMEGLATNVGQLEEGQRSTNLNTDLATARDEEAARQYDVGAEQARRNQVEGGMQNIANLNEQRRQYDINYTESARQARMARQMMRRAARAMRPSSLEKWAAGIGGALKGLGVSGGGS